MTLLPIVDRELRTAARRPRTYYGRMVTAACTVVLAGILLPTLTAQFTVSQGKSLFSVLAAVTFGYCLLIGTRATADCVSSEKREGTLGLLFLTDLRGYDVVLGKLVSSALTAFYGLLAMVPVLALALLLGGVTLSEVGAMALLFANTLFFSASSGVLVSTLSRNDRRAVFATACLIGGVCVLPYAAGIGYAIWLDHLGRAPNSLFEVAALLSPSPVFAYQLLLSNPIRANYSAFYVSILSTQLTAWLFLGMASVAIPHLCRERPPGKKGLRWVEFRAWWSYGSRRRRAAFRRQSLDRNAFYWLAARDRIKAYYVWFFVAAIAGIWGCSAWALHSYVFDWDLSFWLLLLFFLFLKVWFVSEVCSRLVEDRANGSFELLLSSPLDLRQIAHGQSLALWRQFGKPVLVLLTLTGFLLWSAQQSWHDQVSRNEVSLLFLCLMVFLVADLVTLKWVGMWQAINSNQISRAMGTTLGQIILLPAAIFAFTYVALWLTSLATGFDLQKENAAGKACLLYLLIGLANHLFFGVRARWNFLHRFREAATQRYASRSSSLAPFRSIFRSLRDQVRFSRSKVAHPDATAPRWTRWIVRTPVVLALLALLVFAFWKRQQHRQVESELEGIRQQGQPVTIAALRSWLPAVRDADNAGLILSKALPYVLAANRPPTLKIGSKSVNWPGRAAALPSDFVESIDTFLQAHETALHLLHSAAARTNSRFPLDWAGPRQTYLPNIQLARLQHAPPLVELEGLAAIEARDTPRALASIRTLTGLGRAFAQEPFVATQYCRRLALEAATHLTERLLNRQALSNAELQSLSEAFLEAESAAGPVLGRMFVALRCLGIEEMRELDPRLGRPVTSPWQGLLLDLGNWASHLAGVSDRRLLQFIKASEDFFANANQIGKNDAGLLASLDRAAMIDDNNGSFGTGIRKFWFRLMEEQLVLVERLRVARVGLAIEQYRSAHQGQLPETLEDLSPAPLPQLPVDLFAPNQKLRYLPRAKGFTVYSVGPDRQDDGGLEGARLFDNSAKSVRRGLDLTFSVDRKEQ